MTRSNRSVNRAGSEPASLARTTSLAVIGVLAVIYVVAGKLGLSLATAHGSVSLVWPPTGIALAALLVFGSRVWPGIALGAFLVNVATGVGFGVAAGIAAGNTGAGPAGVKLLGPLTLVLLAFDLPPA